MSSLLSRPLPPRVSGAVIVLSLGVALLEALEKPSDPREMILAHASMAPSRTNEVPLQDFSSIKRTELNASTADPFAIPAPPPEQAAPAVPVAPPLPFTYLGRVVDGGRTTVFVARGGENHAIEAGQTVAGSYKVDRITDQAVTFTYLPLKQRQTLAIKGD